jgi:erythromycin esterase-like protein
MEAVRDYLETVDTPTAEAALQALQCFAPYNKDENAYAKATYNATDNCADELIKLLKAVESTIKNENPANKDVFNAIQNSKVAVNAERYFRTAALSGGLSWNIRDKHMSETIDMLLKHQEPGSKIIIWGHNSHIGDAKATNMVDSDIISVGQLVKEKYGSDRTYSIGYGTYSGTVVAAKSWGNKIQIMTIPKAKPDSWEALLHKLGPPDKIIFMQPLQKEASFLQRIKHRAIGVVYNPLQEAGNYIPSVIPKRYDAFIFIDKTTAVTPIQ